LISQPQVYTAMTQISSNASQDLLLEVRRAMLQVSQSANQEPVIENVVLQSMNQYDVDLQARRRQTANQITLVHDPSLVLQVEQCAVCMTNNCNVVFACCHHICMECCQRISESGACTCHICRAPVLIAKWNNHQQVNREEENEQVRGEQGSSGLDLVDDEEELEDEGSADNEDDELVAYHS